MNGFDTILSTALIGTDKLPLQLDALPAEIANAIIIKNADLEEQVLYATSMLSTYNNAGNLPTKIANNTFEKIVETKAIANAEAMRILKNIEATGYYEKEYLCNLWLNKLIQKNEIIPAQWIMPLLNLSVNFNKNSKHKIAQIVGEIGKLIMPLKTEFKYKEVLPSVTDVWKEGNTSERQNYMEALLKTDFTKAFDLIKNDWNTEAITFKKAIIEMLIALPNIEIFDFLEKLYNEEFLFKANEKTTVTQCRKLLANGLLQNTKAKFTIIPKKI